MKKIVGQIAIQHMSRECWPLFNSLSRVVALSFALPWLSACDQPTYDSVNQTSNVEVADTGSSSGDAGSLISRTRSVDQAWYLCPTSCAISFGKLWFAMSS